MGHTSNGEELQMKQKFEVEKSTKMEEYKKVKGEYDRVGYEII